MSHWCISLIVVILTVIALFGDDIRLAFFPKSADEAFSVIMCIIFAVYTVEISLNAISEDKYFNSFYFWLDIISTISLILDINWIMEGMVDYPNVDISDKSSEEIADLAKS